MVKLEIPCFLLADQFSILQISASISVLAPLDYALDMSIALQGKRSFSFRVVCLLFTVYILIAMICACLIMQVCKHLSALSIAEEALVEDEHSFLSQMTVLEKEFSGSSKAIELAYSSTHGRVIESVRRSGQFMQIPLRAQPQIFQHPVPQGGSMQEAAVAAVNSSGHPQSEIYNFESFDPKSSGSDATLLPFVHSADDSMPAGQTFPSRSSALAPKERTSDFPTKPSTQAANSMSRRSGGAAAYPRDQYQSLHVQYELPDSRLEQSSTGNLFQLPYPASYLSAAPVIRVAGVEIGNGLGDSPSQAVQGPSTDAGPEYLEPKPSVSYRSLAAASDRMSGADSELTAKRGAMETFRDYSPAVERLGDKAGAGQLIAGQTGGRLRVDGLLGNYYEEADPRHLEEVFADVLPKQKRKTLARLQRPPAGYAANQLELSSSLVWADSRSPTPNKIWSSSPPSDNAKLFFQR